MVYNFDTLTDRHNTNAIKTDLALARGKPADVLSLWVADMDFPTAPEILEALHKKVDHGIFGYSCLDDSFFDALVSWMKSEHNFSFDRREVVTTPGRFCDKKHGFLRICRNVMNSYGQHPPRRSLKWGNVAADGIISFQELYLERHYLLCCSSNCYPRLQPDER